MIFVVVPHLSLLFGAHIYNLFVIIFIFLFFFGLHKKWDVQKIRN
jgi:hypothetical protein